MDIQLEKLELMKMLLNTESEEAILKVKAVLKKYVSPAGSETELLLSTQANKQHLLQGIEDIKNGKGEKIKIEDLWK